MSVRSKPNRAQIDAHEAAYRLFREGKQGSLRIREGKAVKAHVWPAMADKIAGLNEKTKMVLVFAILVIAMVINGAINLYANHQSENSLKDIAERRMELNHGIQELQNLMSDNRTQIMLGLQHDPAFKYSKLHDHPLSKHLDAITANRDRNIEVLKSLEANVKSEQGKALLAEVKRTREVYLNEGILPAQQAMQEGNYDLAERLLHNQNQPVARGKQKSHSGNDRS